MKTWTSWILGVGVLMSGCQAPRTVVGRWDLNVDQLTNVEVDFQESGDFELRGSYQGFDASIQGTYTFRDERLTVTPTDVEVPELPAPLKAMVQPEIDKLKRPVPFKCNWRNPNELELEPLDSNVDNILNTTIRMVRSDQAGA